MKRPDAATPTPAPLAAAQVADYIRAHPEFLEDYADLIAASLPPARFTRKGGANVADLQQFMVRNLQEELQALRDSTDHLIHTTRSNMTGQTQTHMATLALLATEGLDGLLTAIDQDVPTLTGVDAAALLISVESGGVATLDAPILPRSELDALLEGQPVVLFDSIRGDERLYGAAGGLIRSQALVRIVPGGARPDCLLAIGSRLPGAFHRGQGTELLLFLGEIVAHCLRRCLPEKP
ncbi:MAG: hypothetical protein A2516_11820 [Alphaproteobacteria bacterium RIFOXYD12_FULL_60_8]|nr:MAG: hypothetical protein A2516_11820 [Alphaproteobacteria bacterium RIFOXYD12_FULL_60_8]